MADADVKEPALQVSVDQAGLTTSIRCTGTLDAQTGQCLLDALFDVLVTGTRRVKLDVADLTVADLAGASTLARAQRAARDSGVLVIWCGLDRAHLGGLAPTRHRARQRTRPLGRLRSSPVG